MRIRSDVPTNVMAVEHCCGFEMKLALISGRAQDVHVAFLDRMSVWWILIGVTMI